MLFVCFIRFGVGEHFYFVYVFFFFLMRRLPPRSTQSSRRQRQMCIRDSGDERYLKAAARGAEFVMARLWDGHTLKRSYKDGIARFNAYLEDYALFAGSLIDLYEASLEGRYLELARTMADAILERF